MWSSLQPFNASFKSYQSNKGPRGLIVRYQLIYLKGNNTALFLRIIVSFIFIHKHNWADLSSGNQRAKVWQIYITGILLRCAWYVAQSMCLRRRGLELVAVMIRKCCLNAAEILKGNASKIYPKCCRYVIMYHVTHYFL